jgi:hypothetical protein
MTLDDEVKLNKAIYDADQANLVLENEQFKRAFAMIQQEIIDQWKQSPVRDQEGRERLWNLLQISQKFKLTLESTISTGTLAKRELSVLRGTIQKAKEFVGWA